MKIYANLHTHSTHSDGVYTPAELVKIAKDEGYGAIAITDHDTATAYPELKGKSTSGVIDIAKYLYDDEVDTSNKSAVIDWYYKKKNKDGKSVLHFCKFTGNEVLFATENFFLSLICILFVV